VVTARRAVWPTWLAILAIPAMLALAVLFERELLNGRPFWSSRGRAVVPVLAAVGTVYLIGWIRSSMRLPTRISLRDGCVEFTMFPARIRRVGVSQIESRFGNIHNLASGEQIPVGGLKFRGGEKLHRALRASQGLTC